MQDKINFYLIESLFIFQENKTLSIYTKIYGIKVSVITLYVIIVFLKERKITNEKLLLFHN